MTKRGRKESALVVLVAPWLPHATVDSLDISVDCNCYSEYTTESPSYYVTFKAPRPREEKDRQLSDIVRVLEPMIVQFAMAHHTFTGCSCCQDDDEGNGDYSNVMPSCYVRIIPVRE